MKSPADPEAERHTRLAILGLRAELLYAAVGYGVYSAVSEDDVASAREWRKWLEWVEALIAKRGPQEADPPGSGVDSPEWLTQVIELIDAFERSGGKGHGDLFADEVLRDWARIEFEKLAERARPIEEMAGEPLGEIEDQESSGGMALLSVVQDSLVLVVAEDDDARAMRARSPEIYEALVAAREQGAWDLLADA